MKFINWWINSFTIGAFFLGSVLTGIFSLILLGSLIFGYQPYYKTKSGSVGLTDFEKGIPIHLELSGSIPDTNIQIRTLQGSISGDDPVTVRKYLNEQMAMSNNKLVSSDTTIVQFRAIPWNSKPDFDDKGDYLGKISDMKINGITVHIQPKTFMSRLMLIFPIMLQFFLLAYCAWQLGSFLHLIQNDYSFDESNYKRLRNVGCGLIMYNFVILIFEFFITRFTILIDIQSSRNGFQSPLHLSGNPDLDSGYSYFLDGCIILILASAFRKGHQLQSEQDLTV